MLSVSKRRFPSLVYFVIGCGVGREVGAVCAARFPSLPGSRSAVLGRGIGACSRVAIAAGRVRHCLATPVIFCFSVRRGLGSNSLPFSTSPSKPAHPGDLGVKR